VSNRNSLFGATPASDQIAALEIIQEQGQSLSAGVLPCRVIGVCWIVSATVEHKCGQTMELLLWKGSFMLRTWSTLSAAGRISDTTVRRRSSLRQKNRWQGTNVVKKECSRNMITPSFTVIAAGTVPTDSRHICHLAVGF
jgi:hypothetical protein